MQQAMRPYATTGIALVGATMIAVTPVAPPLPQVQQRSIQLVDAWSDLITETSANLQNIAANADPAAISGVFSALLTNPLGVIQAFTDLTPTVTGALPGGLTVELPPGLELAIAQLGAEGATLNAINDVVSQLATNPSGAFNTLLEAPATIANAYFNGSDNISLLGGIINIAGFNGVLAPLQDISIGLNLTSLIDALGLGDLSLSNLDLSGLLGNITNLGALIDALGLSDDGLGTLLGNPTLGSILDSFGLGGLGLGSLDLTSVLQGLGLDGGVDLNSLDLSQLLGAVGLDAPINTSLINLLDALGLGDFLSQGLGTTLTPNLLEQVLGPLNSVLGELLNGVSLPLLGSLGPVLSGLGIDIGSLLDSDDLISALDQLTIGDLLAGPSISDTVSGVLGALGVGVSDDLTVGGVLTDLGFSPDTGLLTLDDLLGGLSLDNIDLTDFLNGVDLNLGDLLSNLGLSGLTVDLTNLGDLTDLTLGGLLGDLGLGDLGTISIDGFGGLSTLLADVIPQQILSALGM